MDEALLGVADISYRQERYDDALAYYKRLEEEASHKEDRRQGILGQMRCFEHLEGRNSEVLEVTRKVLASEKLSADIEREARYLKAKAHLEQDDTEQAFREFQVLKDNTSSSEGAEARYRVAQILFDRGEWDQSEQEIFDFVDAGTPHQYWIARSFLLLADIYKKRQEFFQARQYLESLLENYQDRDDDIHELAQQRLEELKSAQNTTD
jgi:tetratricopeptide (TPR) repeat protein